MTVRKNELKNILGKITDPTQRKIISDILTGRIVKVVKCTSDQCKDRVVANIYSDNKVKPVVDEDGRMYLRAFRVRLDGYLGFQCWCGNDSRLCEAEKGVTGIENNSVQKEDIEEVLARLEAKPAKYLIKNGKQKIDNFIIEQL